MDLEDRKIWAFDRLTAFYRKRKLNASFFFIARYMEGRHFRYRIRSRAFRKLLHLLHHEGHEIGLHPSRFAFEHPARYPREKARLEHTLGSPVTGMRQHYLRCLFPQIWETAHAMGLLYDTSLGYRRYHGFRAGTSHPFPTFDHRSGTMLNTYAFPLNFF
jgi:peptidoglycan/xylan/chitin deacetylase (PgdA/CDA1 family)